jgi:iron complex outermembrane receptor protein
MKLGMSRLLLGTTALAIVAGVSGAAFAAAGDQLEEITVTAQRRVENLQNVPISISAISAAGIEKTFSRDLMDLRGLAPNVMIDPVLGNGTAAISIRGMQLNDVEKSFDPAVAVYLDGVYLATNTGALLNMWDAEAVEILRGPQGTLFGRNTIGGLIHVRRAKPTGELGGKVSATYGSFNRFDVKGTINLPGIANNTLKTKFSFVTMHGGGYFHNDVLNKREGGNDYLGLTGSALWQPSSDFDLNVTYDYIDDKTPTRPVTSLTSPGELFCASYFSTAGCGAPPYDTSYHRNSKQAVDQPAHLKTHSVIANTNWRFAEGQELVGVFGWRKTNEDTFQKYDGVTTPMFWAHRPQHDKQFSAELRYQAKWDFANLVLGGYYWDSSYGLFQETFAPVLFPAFLASSDRSFDQKTKSYAAFGQADINITKQLVLSLGGRWTHEKKDICDRDFLTLSNGTHFQTDAFGNCDQATAFYLPTGTNPSTGQVFPVSGVASWSNFTPRAGLSYKTDDAMVYATFSKGFRSGGFNGRASSPSNVGPYQPEKVTTFEIGGKSQWLNNRLQLNISAFHTKYKNKQEDVVFPDPVAVTVTLVENASSATIKGLELEAKAIPVTGLTIGGNFAYLDAKYDNWIVPGLGNPAYNVDKSNFALRRAPKYSFALNGMYEYPVGPGKLVLTTSYTWKDTYYVTANTLSASSWADQPGKNKSYGLLDASINYETDSWKFSFFGKNLTNSTYWLHVLDVGTSYNGTSSTNGTPVVIPGAGLFSFGTINAPRTWGGEIQFKF